MTTHITAAALGALDEDRFADLVLNNLGHEAPANLWDLLAGPDLCARTGRVLNAQVKELEAQSADRRAALDALRAECFAEGPPGKDRYFAEKAAVDEWRVRMRRYRRLIDRRLQQVRAGRREAHVVHQARNHSEARTLASKLACAIVEHQRACLAAGITPEVHDRRLWSLLDSLTATFSGEALTLREALDAELWTARPDERFSGDDGPERAA